MTNPWGFAGGFQDGTQLVKFGARYYDPNLGRWTQQDPLAGTILSPGSTNRYLYVGCNPVNAVDPTGRDCFGLAAVGIAELGLSAVVYGGAAASFTLGFLTLPELIGVVPIVTGALLLGSAFQLSEYGTANYKQGVFGTC